MIRKIRAVRSAVGMFRSDDQLEAVEAVVTLAVVVGPWVMRAWKESSAGRETVGVTKQ